MLVTCEDFLLALYGLQREYRDFEFFSEEEILLKLQYDKSNCDYATLKNAMTEMLGGVENPIHYGFCCQKPGEDSYRIRRMQEILSIYGQDGPPTQVIKEVFDNYAPDAYAAYLELDILGFLKEEELSNNVKEAVEIKINQMRFTEEEKYLIYKQFPNWKLVQDTQTKSIQALFFVSIAQAETLGEGSLIVKITPRKLLWFLSKLSIQEPRAYSLLEIASCVIPLSFPKAYLEVASRVLFNTLQFLLTSDQCLFYFETQSVLQMPKDLSFLKVILNPKAPTYAAIEEIHDKAKQNIEVYLAKDNNRLTVNAKLYHEKKMIDSIAAFAKLSPTRRNSLIVQALFHLLPPYYTPCSLSGLVARLVPEAENLLDSQQPKQAWDIMMKMLLSCDYLMVQVDHNNLPHACQFNYRKEVDATDFERMDSSMLQQMLDLKVRCHEAKNLNTALAWVMKSIYSDCLKMNLNYVNSLHLMTLVGKTTKKIPIETVINSLIERQLLKKQNEKYLVQTTPLAKEAAQHLEVNLSLYFSAIPDQQANKPKKSVETSTQASKLGQFGVNSNRSKRRTTVPNTVSNKSQCTDDRVLISSLTSKQ